MNSDIGDSRRSRMPRVAVKLRLESDDKQRVDYWSAREGISTNAYIAEAVQEKIARANGDYDLPTLEILRLAQLVDETKANSINVHNLERVVIDMASSITGLTRGDNYLTEVEDGELPEAGTRQ